MKKLHLTFVFNRALLVLVQFAAMMMSALTGIVILPEFIRNGFSLEVVYGLGLALMIVAIIFLVVTGWGTENS